MPVSRKDRAFAHLRALGKKPFEFQAEAAAACVKAVRRRRGLNRLLVQSPTGTGKTLIAHLTIALLADEITSRPPRVLVVVPTRALLAQHAVDAGWLRTLDLAVNELGPNLPPLLYLRVLESFGIMITTPITLRNRTTVLGASAVAQLDCIIFDEIDTYLTVDELDPKQDIGPALKLCLDKNVPTIGFTGTHLTDHQLRVWERRGFETAQLPVEPDWMPLTPTRFEPIYDQRVQQSDAWISEEIGSLYGQLSTELFGTSGVSISWSEVKQLAREGNTTAGRILHKMTERLELFESAGTDGSKYRAVVEAANQAGPTLVLTRYIHSARLLATTLSKGGINTIQVDGEMSRSEIDSGTAEFRNRGPDDVFALVLTRDLGGRGLDFPSAARVILISPRSNHQTVAQELARIRSRRQNPKEAIIFYYSGTEETGKANRLAAKLAADQYEGQHLFDIPESKSPPKVHLQEFESRNLRNEESLLPAKQT